ncbi:hypothetical protein TIFTF001_005787 [Ficus carica]|uniref:Uncharacterized protein n=1 Tax=Ficus carica TaxID=3494 RepID=A0AA87ZLI3_FICCA|nr:hypothetical protein TIFTF001_005787 [Ficus carica]
MKVDMMGFGVGLHGVERGFGCKKGDSEEGLRGKRRLENWSIGPAKGKKEETGENKGKTGDNE